MMFISSTSLHRAEQGQIDHLWFVFSQYIERRPHNPAFFGVGHIECVAHVIERAQQSAFDLLDRGFGFPLGEVAQRDQLADNVFFVYDCLQISLISCLSASNKMCSVNLYSDWAMAINAAVCAISIFPG